MKRLLEQGGPPLALWLALFSLWLLLVGEWSATVWIAGTCGATGASALGELVRRRARSPASPSIGWTARAWSALPMVLVDFVVLTYALLASLARRRIVRGVYRANRLPAIGGWAGITLAATLSPNAYVVEVDRKSRTALVHDLVPLRASEKPA